MSVSATETMEQFVAEATRMGSIVYRARVPADVGAYILGLAGDGEARSVVKSASPIADRIGLASTLQDGGLDVQETAMGELIAQLSEDRSDPELLVEAARRSLRESCLVADIGISEAAIAVAETGTCILASDDGDDRLVTLLPRLHVTLIDQASLVATWETAMAGLRGLHRDEEGWRMPSFVTYLSGRNTTGDIPGALMARAQGPEAEHIVLLEMS